MSATPTALRTRRLPCFPQWLTAVQLAQMESPEELYVAQLMGLPCQHSFDSYGVHASHCCLSCVPAPQFLC
eukprot:5772360-Amphidinium_carterae.1